MKLAKQGFHGAKVLIETGPIIGAGEVVDFFVIEGSLRLCVFALDFLPGERHG